MSRIHSCSVAPAWRSRLSEGRATYSTLTSIEMSSVGRASTASPIQSRRVAAAGGTAVGSGAVVIGGPSVVGGGLLTHSTNGDRRIRHRDRRFLRAVDRVR